MNKQAIKHEAEMLLLHKKFIKTLNGMEESHGFEPDHGLEEKAKEVEVDVTRNSVGGLILMGNNRKLYALGLYWNDRIKYGQEEADRLWPERLELIK